MLGVVQTLLGPTVSVRKRLWDYQPNWLRIGDWLVMPAENTIVKDDQRVTLEPKVMDLLLFLAMRSDGVQSNDVLLNEVWGGTFYSDNPLHRSIAMLRRALGDSAANPRYIQTLRKRGYQCIASLGFPDQAPNPSTAEQLKFASACPFPGLDAFTAKDAAVFFGRAQALASFGDALCAQWRLGRGLALVLGPSGCGKSSFVQAGIVPLLTSTATPLPARVVACAQWDASENLSAEPLNALIQTIANWRVADREVFLAAELHALLHAPKTQPIDAAASAELTAAFCQNLRRAGLLVEGAASTRCLLLVVDHLELLVRSTLSQQADLTHFAVSPSGETHIDRIFAALAATGAVIIVLTARSDFYQALLRSLPQTMALKAGIGHFDLPPPTAAEIAQMIRSPARLAGLSFERDRSGARLDDVLRDSALAQPESLPLLQFTLEALYERRSANGLLSFAAYEAIGRLEGALVQRAEDALLALPGSAACLPDIFQRMIMLDATHHSASARWVSWADLASDDERHLVQLLVQRRLLVSHQTMPAIAQIGVAPGNTAAQASFRPAHDALLRLWPRAVNWCLENKRLLDVHARVRLASAHWQANGRGRDELLNAGRPVQEAVELMRWAPQAMPAAEVQFVRASIRATQIQERVRKTAIFSLVVLTMIALMAGVYAQHARGIAEQKRQEAEGMVDFLLKDLADKLRPIGRLDLLNAVGQQVLTQYEKNPPAAQDVASTMRRAKAMRVIAESMIGQGALKPAESTLELAQELLEADMTGTKRMPYQQGELILERATIQYWRGYLAYKNADLSRAEIHWRNYLASAQTLLQLAPKNSVWQLELSYALNNLGTLASDQRQFALATDYFSRSRQIKARLHAEKPADASLTADLADTNIWLATVLESSGQLVAAAAQLQAQVELLQGLVAAHPGDSEWLNRLAAAHAHHSRVALNLGDSKAAERGNLQAIDLLKTLTASDPSNELWHYSLAYTYLQQAKLLITQNLDAHRMFLLAQNEVDRFAGRNNPISRWQRLAASLLMSRSDSSGDQSSLGGLLQAEKFFLAIFIAQPNSEDNRYAFAQIQIKLGQYWSAREQASLARPYWYCVLASLQARVSITDPKTCETSLEQATRQTTLGEKQQGKANSVEDVSLAGRRHVKMSQTSDAASLELIARAYVGLGQTDLAKHRIAQLLAAKFRHPEFVRWQTIQSAPPSH